MQVSKYQTIVLLKLSIIVEELGEYTLKSKTKGKPKDVNM